MSQRSLEYHRSPFDSIRSNVENPKTVTRKQVPLVCAGLSSMLHWQSLGDGSFAGQIITEGSAHTTVIKPVSGGWAIGIKGPLPKNIHPFLTKFGIRNGNDYSHLVVPRASGINSIPDLIREITQRLIVAEQGISNEK